MCRRRSENVLAGDREKDSGNPDERMNAIDTSSMATCKAQDGEAKKIVARRAGIISRPRRAQLQIGQRTAASRLADIEARGAIGARALVRGGRHRAAADALYAEDADDTRAAVGAESRGDETGGGGGGGGGGGAGGGGAGVDTDKLANCARP